MARNFKYIIGVDEVGRGPLAGPVAVCAFAMKHNYDKKILAGAKDSKKMAEPARDEWAKKAVEMKKRGECFYKICYSSAGVIDRKGIVKAISSALNRAVLKVAMEIGGWSGRPKGAGVRRGGRPPLSAGHFQIFLDGSLRAPEIFKFQKTIIRGDSKLKIISAASVVAKVARDGVMKKLAKKYPDYGFGEHKGYGTRAHYEAIKKHGLSDIHRKSFLKKIIGN